MFRNAIVRIPGSTFDKGLTTSHLGPPDYTRVLDQHARYCTALRACGLDLVLLDPDRRFPDSTFVEDTAILTQHCAILTRPGAESRRGEVESIRSCLSRFYESIVRIEPPGTVDGGDVCQAEDRFLIGISGRTNVEGARQLSTILAEFGFMPVSIDIRANNRLLHLKSGLAYLGENRMLVVNSLASHEMLRGYEIIHVPAGEEYAGNCVRVNDHILFAAGFPVLEQELARLGNSLLTLEMSEFQKMDGGISCLSLRF
jgi:dimethylargininase